MIGIAAYERARALVINECQRAGTVSLARFRDLYGSSRRVAQLLLERLDSDRVTLRVGDRRRPPAWRRQELAFLAGPGGPAGLQNR